MDIIAETHHYCPIFWVTKGSTSHIIRSSPHIMPFHDEEIGKFPPVLDKFCLDGDLPFAELLYACMHQRSALFIDTVLPCFDSGQHVFLTHRSIIHLHPIVYPM